MHIKDALLKEHSRKQAEKIAANALKNKENLKHLVDFFLSKDKVLSQRAAWAVNLCAEKNPTCLAPYWKKILKNLENKDLHDAVKRNTFRILQFAPVESRHHGPVLQHSFSFLLDRKQAIAIRAFALHVLEKMVLLYPEIGNELIAIIEDELNHEPKPAFKSRAKKVLYTIGKLNP